MKILFYERLIFQRIIQFILNWLVYLVSYIPIPILGPLQQNSIVVNETNKTIIYYLVSQKKTITECWRHILIILHLLPFWFTQHYSLFICQVSVHPLLIFSVSAYSISLPRLSLNISVFSFSFWPFSDYLVSV